MLKQSFWAVATQILVTVCGVVSTIVLNRNLGPAGRGEVGYATLWPLLLAYLCIAGWPPALSSMTSRHPEKSLGLWCSAQAAGLAAGILAMLAGWFLLPFLLRNTPEAVSLSRWFLICIPASIASILGSTILEALGRFDQHV